MKTVAVIVTLLIHQAVANSSSQSQTVNTGFNRFAQKLYANLTQNSWDNLLVCPLSLHSSLALVHQGAGGNTAAELATVLGLHADKNTIREGYQHILNKMESRGDAHTMATKLFPAANFQINRDYVRVARKYFLSDVEGVDYSAPDQAANQINEYVEEKTNNKIENFISPDALSSRTRLVVVNAVHFQASWQNKFSETHESSFKSSDHRTLGNIFYRANMMTQVNYFKYKHDRELDAQVIMLDYAEGDYSMVIILPRKDDGLNAMERRLAINDFRSVLQGMRKEKVEVTIPKFKFEMKYDMKKVLEKMGVSDLFDESAAELSGIAREEDLFVSDIWQKTFIEVNEHGTEAGAATGVSLSEKSGAVQFKADHPFFFALVHNADHLMFYGRLMHPKSPSSY